MLETLDLYKIVIIALFIGAIVYALLNDPIKKNKLH